MINFNNDQYVIGFTLVYKHYIYHWRYFKIRKGWDIGRQYL
jgi:hypothetical protein